MSRIGKKIIVIPAGVEINQTGTTLTVKGPKGTLTRELLPMIKVNINGAVANLTIDNPEDQQQKAYWGLFRKLIANMVNGVANNFSKKLEINGVGYRVALSGNKLILNLGYSHPIDFPLPAGISAVVENNQITILGADNELVGQVAANIRKLRKPEPYKGKGIKYSDEIIRRKSGKAAKAA